MSDDAPPIHGRCLCGAVRWAYDPPALWRGHCHCESCRRSVSAGFASFIGVEKARFRHLGAAPQAYRSSPGTIRRFCGTCGAPVSYESDRWPDEIHLYAAGLDDPSAYAPEFHVHHGEALAWAEPADSLPRHAQGSEA